MKAEHLKYISHITTVMLFCFILILPLLAKLAGIEDTEAIGTQMPISMPDTADVAIADYPQKLESFFNRSFVFRNRCIYLYRKYQLEILNSRNTGAVLVGLNDWLYYRRDGDSIGDYLGLQPLSKRKLDVCYRAIDTIREKLQKANIKFLFVIAPNKCTIYPEFLPENIRQNSQQTHRRHFMNFLEKQNCNVNVIDLSKTLLAAKEDYSDRLFYKLDTHWNANGRYLAYKTICRRLNDMLSNNIVPLALGSDMQIVSQDRQDYDLLRLLGSDVSIEIPKEQFLTLTPDENIVRVPNKKLRAILESQRTENSPQSKLATFENPNASGCCVIFCDSFLAPLGGLDRDAGRDQPLEWTRHFARTLRLHPRELSPKVLDYIIENEKPDVVILQYVERAFPRVRKTVK